MSTAVSSVKPQLLFYLSHSSVLKAASKLRGRRRGEAPVGVGRAAAVAKGSFVCGTHLAGPSGLTWRSLDTFGTRVEQF